MEGLIDYGDLLRHCVQIQETYKAKKNSPDWHVQQYFQNHKFADTDALFVEQVFYGLLRYKSMLKILLDEFYKRNAGKSLLKDSTLYSTLAYLMLIRLDELSFPEFEQFIVSQGALRMHVFLAFMFDLSQFEGAIKEHWCSLYDEQFVEKELLGRLRKYEPEARPLLDRLQTKIEGILSTPVEEKLPQVTVPQPFNLTPVKPKQAEKIEENEFKIEARPVPKSVYETTTHEKWLKKLETAKVENRKQTEAKYKDYKPFNFLSDNRPSNKDKIRKEVEEARAAELQFDKPKANPVPSFLYEGKDNVQTDLSNATKAAILRQDALYRKRQLEEVKILKAYEHERRDSSEFYQWQQEMRERDELLKQVDIERRKLEMKLAREDAMEARVKQYEENKQIVAILKKEKEEIERRKQKIKAVDESSKKTIVKKVQSQREAPKLAKEEVLKKKQEIAMEMAKEQEERRRQQEEQIRIEKEQREDLILQIRALEKVPKATLKKVNDICESSGSGVLTEMSIAELREKLQILKEIEEEEREEKREQIKRQRQKNETDLKQRKEFIARVRKQQEEAAAVKRAEQHKKEEARLKMEKLKKDEAILKLHEKLEKKKQERTERRKTLALERKKATETILAISGGRESLEEKKFEEEELALERSIKERQEAKLKMAYTALQRKEREDQERLKMVSKKEKPAIMSLKDSPDQVAARS